MKAAVIGVTMMSLGIAKNAAEKLEKCSFDVLPVECIDYEDEESLVEKHSIRLRQIDKA